MSQNNKQNFLANAAKTLYGAQRKKDEEEKNLRNSLLNDLGDKAEAKHILYSSNEDLIKMKKEMNVSPPLPESKIKSTPIESDNVKLDLSHKPKLLDKIPIRKEELNVSAKFAPEDWDKEEEKPAVDIKQEKMDEIDNSIFSDDALKKAREFIIGSEGFREDAYQDTGGVWTIGYGHIKNVKPGDKITREEAEKLYRQDFEEHSAYLKHVKVPLNDNEKTALTSLIYNIGPNAFKNSTLLKKLNEGDKKGAAEEFDRWIYDNGKVQNGLINRRKREKELFSTTD